MRYFEDFYPGEQIELGSRQLTELEIIDFARQFDPQPFHVNHQAGQKSLFGGLVASGWHTAAIYMRLSVDNLLSQTDSLGSPGLEELRWPKPVYPGDTLSARMTVLECKESKSRPNMGIIRFSSEVSNQHGVVVMSLTGTGFFGRKP